MLFVLGLGSGCAFTQMETSRQLSGGEWVVSGSLDVPGGLESYDPYLTWVESRAFTTRMSGQATYGLGGRGDLSVHMGSTRFTRNFGASGRVYPTKWLNLGLQADYIDLMRAVTATPRITTTTTDERWFYGGLQTMFLLGTEPEERFLSFVGGTAGIIAGAERVVDWFPYPLGFQVEGTLAPFYYGYSADEQGRRGGTFWSEQRTAGLYQLGLGVNLRY